MTEIQYLFLLETFDQVFRILRPVTNDPVNHIHRQAVRKAVLTLANGMEMLKTAHDEEDDARRNEQHPGDVGPSMN